LLENIYIYFNRLYENKHVTFSYTHFHFHIYLVFDNEHVMLLNDFCFCFFFNTILNILYFEIAMHRSIIHFISVLKYIINIQSIFLSLKCNSCSTSTLVLILVLKPFDQT